LKSTTEGTEHTEENPVVLLGELGGSEQLS